VTRARLRQLETGRSSIAGRSGEPPQAPGRLYSGAMFAAASICSGVSSTTVLTFVEPDRLMLNASAAAASSLGSSATA